GRLSGSPSVRAPGVEPSGVAVPLPPLPRPSGTRLRGVRRRARLPGLRGRRAASGGRPGRGRGRTGAGDRPRRRATNDGEPHGAVADRLPLRARPSDRARYGPPSDPFPPARLLRPGVVVGAIAAPRRALPHGCDSPSPEEAPASGPIFFSARYF